MKNLGWAAFSLLAALFVATFAIGIWATLNDEAKDPAELAARKEQCRKLERHLLEISPEKPANVDEAVAKVPIVDIEQGAAEDKDKNKKDAVDKKPPAVACMMVAQTPDAVKACVPKPAE